MPGIARWPASSKALKHPPKQLCRRFLDTPARLTVTDQHVTVQLQRRAHHPILLASKLLNSTPAVPWWQGRQLRLQIG